MSVTIRIIIIIIIQIVNLADSDTYVRCSAESHK